MKDNQARAQAIWKFVARGADGKIKWIDEGKNLIVDEGLDYWLGASLSGASLFVGLTDGAPTPNAADTMAIHAGWVEVEDYDEAARQAWVQGAVVDQAIDNAGNVATFTISGATTVGGGFMSTDATKGGTAGTLFNVRAAAEGDRALIAGDSLEVTVAVGLASV